jgi:hypothetical protein
MIRKLALLAASATLLGITSPANATQLEGPDREVINGLSVQYNEFIPSRQYPNRRYFELNDGSAWRYLHYGACAKADRLPNRICKTVFWYAR